jgi:hypothetical protein
MDAEISRNGNCNASTAAQRLWLFGGRLWIGSPHLGAGLFGGEHQFDAGAAGIAPLLPGGDLAEKPVAAFDAPVAIFEALAKSGTPVPESDLP